MQTFRIWASILFLILFIQPVVSHSELQAFFPEVSDLPSNPDLPDPFVMMDGTPVKTPEQWFQLRRPELKQLFQYYMYGFMPEPPKIRCTITKTEVNALGGQATLKEVEIVFTELPATAPKIHLALFIPNKKPGPFPVFLGINSHGNQTVADEPAITFNADVLLSGRDKQGGVNERGSLKDFWCVEQKIGRGYAFAVFYQGDIDPRQSHENNGYPADRIFKK